MIIKKVIIDNFKSIDHIELDFDRVGESYTKIFVGINESGKSNILEALSFFEVPEFNASFDQYCNQKFEEKDECNIKFLLEFEENEDYNKCLSESIVSNTDFHVVLKNVIKDVYLNRDFNSFSFNYDYDIELPKKELFIVKREILNEKNAKFIEKWVIDNQKHEDETAELLTKDTFLERFGDIIDDFIQTHEARVSLWKPSPEYLLSDVDLNTFKNDVSSNKPLKNIFKLSGYTDSKSIIDVINKISISRNRSKLIGKLNDSLNKYINRVWDNNIDLIIEITETGKFSLLIRDKGKENEHDRFAITDRSQGAKQFLSLILSLSLETTNLERKNELILIDEPEVHLHPSGIRDMSRELLKIGQNNYVFLATHSPFMIDKQHKERHFIVKKDRMAITCISKIQETDNIIDDEVLNEAFGINVYRDLLNPHSLLVEGATDKIILQKAFAKLNRDNIGITNGHGSNIDTIASKMNFDNISLLVVTDDDKVGRNYKENILKIEGAFNIDTVFTIRDLEGGIINYGTIEDTLGIKYVETQFLKFYKTTFGEELEGFTLSEDKPVLFQIITILKKKKKYSNWNMDAFKKYVSDELNLPKTTFHTKFPLLHSLATKIISKLDSNKNLAKST